MVLNFIDVLVTILTVCCLLSSAADSVFPWYESVECPSWTCPQNFALAPAAYLSCFLLWNLCTLPWLFLRFYEDPNPQPVVHSCPKMACTVIRLQYNTILLSKPSVIGDRWHRAFLLPTSFYACCDWACISSARTNLTTFILLSIQSWQINSLSRPGCYSNEQIERKRQHWIHLDKCMSLFYASLARR